MRKPPNPSQSFRRQERIEEIRLLLCQRNLTTAQIQYLTGIKSGTLVHYMLELESKNYVAHMKLAVKGCQSVNLYRITADGRNVRPKPSAPNIPEPAASINLQWWNINLRGAVNEKAAR